MKISMIQQACISEFCGFVLINIIYLLVSAELRQVIKWKGKKIL